MQDAAISAGGVVADFTADVGQDSDCRETGKLAKGFILVK